ncbi:MULTISPECIES: DUF5107 domain-containing protein [Arthrobacter]|uniref:DUF5107 domain-containing protein n=2 Tax=Arthrobacter TaxID=1663 RepID=A0ABU9KMX7_9MICC|nr:DUF5107 domain-containing protein [Arthrobacter sp. YJM1]MDP5227944.1 DUF5107 domain-containing protein [Arthrobacter sp. YJM1]
MPGPVVSSRILNIPTGNVDGALPLVGPLPDTPYDPGAAAEAGLGDISYGQPASLFPYTAQDGYSRVLEPREVRTVTLENRHLRAVFLPEWGGRLWELFDKAGGKHLLHTQNSLQLANFALRNAWFAGGIEWNIGTRGHSPSTCEPLHHGVVTGPDGQEVLRMWDYERLRGLVFQVDAWLPEDSRVLFVSFRVSNAQDHEVPLYWWTNAAVPQDPHSRVLAPATESYSSDYRSIVKVDPTAFEGRDCTWPARNAHAADFFFDLPEHGRRWILNADRDGDGLAMLSTERLRGRKLFVWGDGTGGRHWQRWLSPDGGEYAEIQAGLAQTQFQHLPLPARTAWTWTEAYGNAAVTPSAAHSEDWGAAVAHSAERVETLLSSADLAAAHAEADGFRDAPVRVLGAGNGWGALESLSRAEPIDSAATPFPESWLGPEQAPWVGLLREGTFAGAPSFVAGPEWEARLAALPPTAETLLHRALIAHGAGLGDRARGLYTESLGLRESALARRGLALLAHDGGADEEVVEHYRAACLAAPGDRRLLAEAAEAMLDTQAPADALELLDRVSLDDPAAQFHGRLLLLKARSLAGLGRLDEVAALLKAGIEVPDLREGVNVLRELWEAAVPGEPLPVEYDFTMS